MSIRKDYRLDILKKTSKACRGCINCNGYGCIGEVPGMGGKGKALTFINNYKSWNVIDTPLGDIPEIGVAPMTGVEQNMGNPFPEDEFHDYMVKGAKTAGILSCIGDGAPDFKLKYGGDALRNSGVKGIAFIKPYSNDLIKERVEWVEDVIHTIGIDIDSYKIDTMKGMVTMEKKDSAMLLDLKNHFKSTYNKPFAIKGVVDFEDIEMVKEVKPDICVVSNHGGRVFDNGEGIAFRLKELYPLIKDFCGEVWVDGGLRTLEHLKKASSLGATRVLLGRPFIQVTSVFKEKGIPNLLKEMNYSF